MDFFFDTNYTVELEKDLSLKQQFLDAIILERVSSNKPPPQSPPDGLDNLSKHNLISYKSLREPLDAWALDELIGHFVNYRKQISPSMNNLLAEHEFQLYAICTRHPKKLAAMIPLEPVQQGVFEVQWGVRRIRILILSEMPLSNQNAIWQIFSGVSKGFRFGQDRYQWKMSDISQIIRLLYTREEIEMSYTAEDFQRDLPKELLTMLSETQRTDLIEGLPPEDRMKGLLGEDRIKGLPPEELQKIFELLSKTLKNN